MKILAFSDTHLLRQNQIPIPQEEFDLLIFCGDMCNAGTSPLEVLKAFAWFEKFKAKKKIIIPGNHDRILDAGLFTKYYKEFKGSDDKPWTRDIFKQFDNMNSFGFWRQVAKEYGLHLAMDELVEYEGLKIYCSAYSLKFGDWAFGLTEKEYEQHLQRIPRKIDILACHNMPYFGSSEPIWLNKETNGSNILFKAIKKIQPKLFLGGHWHREPNYFRPYNKKLGRTTCLNVSLLDDRYRYSWGFTKLEFKKWKTKSSLKLLK